MERNNNTADLINNIKFKMVNFLRNRAQRSTCQIVLTKNQRVFLLRYFNETRFVNGLQFIRQNRLNVYLRHREHERNYFINNFEIKINKIITKTIQKRRRIISVKSPPTMSIRMTKTRNLNLAPEQRNMLLQYARNYFRN